MTGDAPVDKVVPYFCPGCDAIVRIDVELDEVLSSSSSGSFRAVPRKRTILVADDSVLILRQCQELLTEHGYHVLLAQDGAEALRLVREHHPEVVLLDLLMPTMTGFDVLREIRDDERVKDTIVLAISGVYKEGVLDFLHQRGAQGFLDKEHIKDELVFRVASLLDPPPTTGPTS